MQPWLEREPLPFPTLRLWIISLAHFPGRTGHAGVTCFGHVVV